MNVSDAIKERRAYRSLDPVEITEELIRDLAWHAGMSASCFNNQPWRFVFVRIPEALRELHGALPRGNAWAKHASMIIAVFSRPEDDCIIRGREYHQFDTGMATALLILRATELGLVAHPIGGYREEVVKEVLGIPEEVQIITLVNVGKHAEAIYDYLSNDQKESERNRPERLPFYGFAYIDRYTGRAMFPKLPL
jgi:nitroreductase